MPLNFFLFQGNGHDASELTLLIVICTIGWGALQRRFIQLSTAKIGVHSVTGSYGRGLAYCKPYRPVPDGLTGSTIYWTLA